MARRRKATKKRARRGAPGFSKANVATGALLGEMAPQFLGELTPITMAALALIPGGLGLGAIGKTAAATWAAKNAKKLIGGTD